MCIVSKQIISSNTIQLFHRTITATIAGNKVVQYSCWEWLYKLQTHDQAVHMLPVLPAQFIFIWRSWAGQGTIKNLFTLELFLNTVLLFRGALFGVFLPHFYRRWIISSRRSLCSLFPNIPGLDSRGGGHKSHPLRDYTLLKAYDPGWMESRAVEGPTGKTPACLEWLWLTHWPYSVPHSQPHKQVYYWSPASIFDCWWSKSKSSVVYQI